MSNSLMLKISMVAAAAGAAVMQIPSAEAQTVAVPVTGGGFTVLTNVTEGLSTSNYTTQPTFVTPVGTITVTSAGLPIWQGITINSTDTAIGVNINGINGSVSLNDGRNATLTNNSAFLQALARVTSKPEGAESFNPPSSESFNPDGNYTIVANFKSGSVNVPQSAFSPLPSPQLVIPITDGTFTLNIPANQAAFPVITTSSLVTPLGTANLTLTFPASVPSSEGAFLDTKNPADISVVVNGSVVLSDGRIANFNNRLVTFQTSAGVTVPSAGFYQVADVPLKFPITVEGDFSNFRLSILESDIISPVVIPPAQSPAFLLTQSSDSTLVPFVVPEKDDSPLSQRRF